MQTVTLGKFIIRESTGSGQHRPYSFIIELPHPKGNIRVEGNTRFFSSAYKAMRAGTLRALLLTDAETLYFLNEYLTDKAYGGAEEGGWWYNVGEYVRCHGVHEHLAAAQEALEITRQHYLLQEQAGQARPDSVACTGYPDIFIQEHPGRDYPSKRPCYS